MCGFVGYFGDKKQNLNAALEAIRHRGPDMGGVRAGEFWTVGFNRLSIIDVSEHGMQPFSYDKVTVYANGEIYNYKELKAEHEKEFTCQSGSDIEILPFLYRKYGLDFLNKLNGMFAMVVIDERSDNAFLIRDRYGKKPLYYKATSEGVYFGSETKALKQLVTLEPDKTNIASNFLCWFLVQPLSLYKDTFHVNPGAIVELKRGQSPREFRWYKPNIKVKEQSFAEIQENFLQRYRRSIEFRLRSDVPVGIFLSGGLDSTSIAYLANELSTQPITAFTANIQGKERLEQNNTDVEVPRMLCEQLGWRRIETALNFDFFDKNIVSIVSNFEELLFDSGTLVFYALSEAARANGVKVVFTGVGGDELFGGYPWQSRIRSIPQFLARRSLKKPYSQTSLKFQQGLLRMGSNYPRKMASAHRLSELTRLWHAKSLSGVFQSLMTDRDIDVSERIDLYAREYFQNAMSYVDDDLYNQFHFANIFTVIGHQNSMSDLGCMFHSVENRSPFLDVDLFEYMMSVPDHIKIADGPKSLSRKIFSEFMPDYVTKAKKSGPTMPLNVWFGENAEIRARLNRFIGRNLELVAEYVSPELADKIKKDDTLLYQSQSLPAFSMISFLLWAKMNIEGSVKDTRVAFSELLK